LKKLLLKNMAACGASNDDDAKVDNSNATVFPAEDFDAESDAKVLYKAMKGLGTNEKKIIEIVCNRSAMQLLQVQSKFKECYGKKLEDRLKSELKGDLEDIVITRMYPKCTLAAYFLRKAMKGAGTDEEALIATICTMQSNKEVNDCKKAYAAMYDRDLEKDLKSETRGDFENLLVSLIQGKRSEDDVDDDKAKKEAAELKEAGADKWGTDEAEFNRILCTRSFPQLRATFKAYTKLTGKTMADAVKSEMSGDLKDGFLTLVRVVEDPIEYYATTLRKAMKGVGTDEDVLTRIFASRCEIDLGLIKARYNHEFARDLTKDIKSELKGDYEKCMLALLKGPKPQ